MRAIPARGSSAWTSRVLVEAVAPDVTPFGPGDEVYGMTGGVGGIQGTLADYAAVDAEPLAAKPTISPCAEAAALPLVTITAWQGLVDHAHIRPGQTLLVQGGAGGVEHIASADRTRFGCRGLRNRQRGQVPVSSARSAPRRSTMRASGSKTMSPATPAAKASIWFMTLVAARVLDASFQAVKRFGHVVGALGWGNHSLAPLSFKDGTCSGVFTLAPLLTGVGRAHLGDILTQATQLIEAGRLRPRLDPRNFTLG